MNILDILAVIPLDNNRRNPEFDDDVEFTPCIELTEDNENYTARFELPGIPPDQIKLTITDDGLRLETERRPRRNPNEKVLTNQVGYGKLVKELNPPPETVILDKVTAEHFHGVLTVRMPKQQAQQALPKRAPRTISITPVG